MKEWFRRLFDDGLNHDWDGEWTNEDAADVQEHLRKVECRAPMGDKLLAWQRWL